MIKDSTNNCTVLATPVVWRHRPDYSSIACRLRLHLASEDGTANDATTDEFYREWFSVREDQDTDLEEVERWAFEILNP